MKKLSNKMLLAALVGSGLPSAAFSMNYGLTTLAETEGGLTFDINGKGSVVWTESTGSGHPTHGDPLEVKLWNGSATSVLATTSYDYGTNRININKRDKVVWTDTAPESSLTLHNRINTWQDGQLSQFYIGEAMITKSELNNNGQYAWAEGVENNLQFNVGLYDGRTVTKVSTPEETSTFLVSVNNKGQLLYKNQYSGSLQELRLWNGEETFYLWREGEMPEVGAIKAAHLNDRGMAVWVGEYDGNQHMYIGDGTDVFGPPPVGVGVNIVCLDMNDFNQVVWAEVVPSINKVNVQYWDVEGLATVDSFDLPLQACPQINDRGDIAWVSNSLLRVKNKDLEYASHDLSSAGPVQTVDLVLGDGGDLAWSMNGDLVVANLLDKEPLSPDAKIQNLIDQVNGLGIEASAKAILTSDLVLARDNYRLGDQNGNNRSVENLFSARSVIYALANYYQETTVSDQLIADVETIITLVKSQ